MPRSFIADITQVGFIRGVHGVAKRYFAMEISYDVKLHAHTHTHAGTYAGTYGYLHSNGAWLSKSVAGKPIVSLF